MSQALNRPYTISSFRKLSQEEQKRRILSLSDEEAYALSYDWDFWARDNQLEPPFDTTNQHTNTIKPLWSHWLILAGRGFGKTRTGAEYVRRAAERGEAKRIALIAPTSADYRDTMIEGESGILAISPAHFKPVWEPSKRRLTWPNGTIATCYSAEEPERLRGPQHDLAWCDELCAWKYQQASWDMLMFGLRLGSHPRSIITTTPKPTTFIKELIQDESVVITRGSTFDNFDNLADTFKQQIVKKYDGTRLGRQELYAEIMTDIPGALWNDKNIEALRRDNLPPFKRIIVAVDPPVTSGPDADECGIIIAGRGDDGHIYIIEDESIQGLSPHGWCERVIKAYEAFNADRVIAEVNNGGELIENLLRHVKQTVSYKAVRASRGKLARAEPICALYEQGLVHHVQRFAKLEKQMCEFTSDFNKNIMGYSPDRVDALVWAVTELMEEQINPQLRYL